MSRARVGLRGLPVANVTFEDRGFASPCWIWQGRVNAKGYAIHRSARVHRSIYVEFKGAIPDGLTLDHLCRVKNCVNPDHLEPVTAAENARRAWEAGAYAGVDRKADGAKRKPRTHCKRGHALTDENVFPGTRQCRTCKRDNKRLREASLPPRKRVRIRVNGKQIDVTNRIHDGGVTN